MRCRMACCRAEEPRGFAVTAGLAGQTRRGIPGCRGCPGTPRLRRRSASASWASRSACSGSPCAIATRARVVSATTRYQPVAVDTASSAQRRAASEIPARQRGLGMKARHTRRKLGQDTHVLPGGLARVLRRRNIAGGQGRGSQRRSSRRPRKTRQARRAASRAASAAARAAAASPWYASAKP